MKIPQFTLMVLFLLQAATTSPAFSQSLEETAAGIAHDSRELKGQLEEMPSDSNTRAAIRYLRSLNELALSLGSPIRSKDERPIDIGEVTLEIEEKFLILSRYIRKLELNDDRRFRLLRSKIYALKDMVFPPEEAD